MQWNTMDMGSYLKIIEMQLLIDTFYILNNS